MTEYFNTKPIKGNIQRAIADETAKALTLFCEQEPEFRQAIEQSGKTFQQCLDAVAKGVGKSISDLQAYQKAVEFYFTGAKVHFRMEIDLIGGLGGKATPLPEVSEANGEAKPPALRPPITIIRRRQNEMTGGLRFFKSRRYIQKNQELRGI